MYLISCILLMHFPYNFYGTDTDTLFLLNVVLFVLQGMKKPWGSKKKKMIQAKKKQIWRYCIVAALQHLPKILAVAKNPHEEAQKPCGFFATSKAPAKAPKQIKLTFIWNLDSPQGSESCQPSPTCTLYDPHMACKAWGGINMKIQGKERDFCGANQEWRRSL